GLLSITWTEGRIFGSPLGQPYPRARNSMLRCGKEATATITGQLCWAAPRSGHVKADDILHLVDKQRIGRELEGLAPMRLQSEGGPDPADRGMRQARRRSHRTDRPMGGVLRRGVQRPFDDLGHLDVRYRAGPAGTIFVGETFNPVPDE